MNHHDDFLLTVASVYLSENISIRNPSYRPPPLRVVEIFERRQHNGTVGSVAVSQFQSSWLDQVAQVTVLIGYIHVSHPVFLGWLSDRP